MPCLDHRVSLSVVLDNVPDMDHFIPLGLMGVRVVRCPQLGQDSVWCPDFQLLVVDADLSPDDAEDVACQALGALVSLLADAS